MEQQTAGVRILRKARFIKYLENPKDETLMIFDKKLHSIKFGGTKLRTTEKQAEMHLKKYELTDRPKTKIEFARLKNYRKTQRTRGI